MAAMVLKMKSNSQGSHLPSSLCACALPCRFCHSASISWPSWSTACAKHDSERGDWHPPRTHQWPIHHRQLTSNSLTTPSTAPAANRWMDSLSPVRPPQLWPPYEPGGAIQKASKCRMLGIVKLGTFNQFSGCGYGALTGPLWICASATAWATMLRSNSWAASNQSQRQVPSNGRPFEKFLFEMFEIKSLSCVKAFVRVVERSIVRARSSLEVPDFQKQFGTTSAELKLDEA